MSISMSAAPVSAPTDAGRPSHFSPKNIAVAMLTLSVLAGGITKRDEIGEAVADLTRSVKHLSFMGLEIQFNETLISKTVRHDIFEHLDDKAKAAIARDAGGLSNAELVRLLNVGLFVKLCDYELATLQMKNDMAADLSLRDKGLVEIRKDDQEMAALVAEIRKKPRDSWTIGNPKFCYHVTLTDDGRNVRTAMVYAYANGLTRQGG